MFSRLVRASGQGTRSTLIVAAAPVPLVQATTAAPFTGATTGYTAAEPLTTVRENVVWPAPLAVARPTAARRVPFATSSHAATIDPSPATASVG